MDRQVFAVSINLNLRPFNATERRETREIDTNLLKARDAKNEREKERERAGGRASSQNKS